MKKKWLSYEERKVDALALGAEEGRDKLRKATGSCKWAEIRRYPNVGTQPMQIGYSYMNT